MFNKKIFFAGAVALVAISIGVTTFAKNDHVKERHAPICERGNRDESVGCHARVVVDEKGAPKAATLPNGFGPADFHGAYVASTTAPNKQIIAIVDAYDHPRILSDLNTYSTTFGIPTLPACVGSIASSAVPCFKKVDQNGGTAYPKINAGWALEIALDVQTAHAMCQNCSILLVEATTNSYANMMAAVDRAVFMGATAISNSYGSNEFSSQTAFDYHFNHPGIAITVSAGDAGYGPEYPAASQYVTAVGGTSLYLNPDKSWQNETVWSGTGSGCSLYETKPAWQFDTGCANRTIADVAAVADPSTGAAVYSSVRYGGRTGWFKVGGTSLSAPLIAGVYALAGGVPTGVHGSSLPYANAGFLHDVISGSNGACGTYLCMAGFGFDGPTGLGTPMGTGAF